MDNTRSAFVNFNLQFEAERFAFGFNKLKHEDVIKDIHDHNEKLGTFLELTGEIATLHERSSQGVSRTAPKYLLQYWRHAERLYNMIKHGAASAEMYIVLASGSSTGHLPPLSSTC